MGLSKEIESKLDALTRAATLYFETGDALGMKAAYDAAVSAITRALAERDARIAELEDAMRRALGRLGFKAGLTEFGRIHEATRILNEAIAKGGV